MIDILLETTFWGSIAAAVLAVAAVSIIIALLVGRMVADWRLER